MRRQACSTSFEQQWDDETDRVSADGLPSVGFEDVAATCQRWSTRRALSSTTHRATTGCITARIRVTAIAVGGNTLSRGLTLEGLCVSFFVRTSNAYDTLAADGPVVRLPARLPGSPSDLDDGGDGGLVPSSRHR